MQLSVSIDIAESWSDEFRVARLIAQQERSLLQRNAMSNVGRPQSVAIRDAGLNVLAQPLKGDLRGGAHDIDLDAGIFRAERTSHAFRCFRRIVRTVPGKFALALRGFVERLFSVAHLGEAGAWQQGGRCEARRNKGSTAYHLIILQRAADRSATNCSSGVHLKELTQTLLVSF